MAHPADETPVGADLSRAPPIYRPKYASTSVPSRHVILSAAKDLLAPDIRLWQRNGPPWRRNPRRRRFIARTADLSAYANPTTYPDEFLNLH